MKLCDLSFLYMRSNPKERGKMKRVGSSLVDVDMRFNLVCFYF